MLQRILHYTIFIEKVAFLAQYICFRFYYFGCFLWFDFKCIFCSRLVLDFPVFYLQLFNFSPLAVAAWIDQHCMAIQDFRPLGCLSIMVSVFIGWSCNWDGLSLAGPDDASAVDMVACESTHLGFRMSRKIGRTLAANFSNSGIFVLLLITFQSALLWYGAPCGARPGKFILGQGRHALICRHMSCYLAHAGWPLLGKFLDKVHQVAIAHLESFCFPLGPDTSITLQNELLVTGTEPYFSGYTQYHLFFTLFVNSIFYSVYLYVYMSVWKTWKVLPSLLKCSWDKS